MVRTGVNRSNIVDTFDTFFGVRKLDADPAMSRFVPQVYRGRDVAFFERDFVRRCNGLMVKGSDTVHTIFASSFPHDPVLKTFLTQAQEGDMLFLHHPIRLESGDPKGKAGRGFLPANKKLLSQIVKKKLSVYSCHAPLDYNKKISTGRAIAKALEASVTDEFLPYGNGMAGLVATVSPTTTAQLVKNVVRLFDIPYADTAGAKRTSITRIAIVPGGGDDVSYMKDAERLGAHAYITGDIFSHYQSRWGRMNSETVREFAKGTGMSLIGVSHASSEFLVMKTLFADWVHRTFRIPVIPIAQPEWYL